MSYRGNTKAAGMAKWLRDADAHENSPVVVLTHVKPDGDALGSMMGLVGALRYVGIPAQGWLIGPVPAALRPFAEALGIQELESGAPLHPRPAAAVLVDTGSWAQCDAGLGWVKPWLEANLLRSAIVDHHLSGDVPGEKRWIDHQAAACSEMIAELAEALGCPILDADKQDKSLQPLREALYLGIATDTGWFRFSNTREQTLSLAAKLLATGVDGAGLYIRVEHQDRPARLSLMAAALNNIRWLAGERGALMVLSAEDFKRTGARLAETEGIVDFPRKVAGVRVACLATEQLLDGGKSRVRLSFRSNPGERAVDVSKLANRFGGGGHARAAGAKLDGTLSDVIARVEQAIADCCRC